MRLYHALILLSTAALPAECFSPRAWGDPLPSYGVSNYSCPGTTMRRSKIVPTNAHSVRPADIKIVAALGDSLTAGNGAGAEDPLAIVLQYRGLTFIGGGEKTLEEQVTIPKVGGGKIQDVLKKYNPNLFGYSIGTSSPNVWEIARLNIAMPGGHSSDMPGQARQLVQLLQSHSEVIDFENDWKLVNIFIGGNDDTETPDNFGNGLREAIQILYDRVPRVIVSLLSMFHLEMLRESDMGQFFCQALHTRECGCEMNANFTNAQIAALCISYQEQAMALQVGGMFDRKDDFTLVVQTAVNNSTEPPMKDGHPDQTFFSPDCFHFSQYGHAITATWVWQNLMEPVGGKTIKANISIPAAPLACPDQSCPFIRTTKNSANCGVYLTDPADN